jgi:hypothetical protein
MSSAFLIVAPVDDRAWASHRCAPGMPEKPIGQCRRTNRIAWIPVLTGTRVREAEPGAQKRRGFRRAFVSKPERLLTSS